ncbi:MAG TPA: hypothetical protein VHJ54_01835 [Solirubrobacterales bacterium]|jgi:hypothetical protein|nr:hypothetical protein [Solirubrobacterales bacterium]
MATRDQSNGSVGSAADALQARVGSREERIAYNEAWSRSLNERCAEWANAQGARSSFRCECWQADCRARIPLSSQDWKLIRAERNRFAVAPDHVADKFEAVIRAFPHFWVIEKFGEAGQIAEKLAGLDARLSRPPM